MTVFKKLYFSEINSFTEVEANQSLIGLSPLYFFLLEHEIPNFV